MRRWARDADSVADGGYLAVLVGCSREEIQMTVFCTLCETEVNVYDDSMGCACESPNRGFEFGVGDVAPSFWEIGLTAKKTVPVTEAQLEALKPEDIETVAGYTLERGR